MPLTFESVIALSCCKSPSHASTLRSKTRFWADDRLTRGNSKNQP
jgi:hypothetical protein